MAKLKPEVRFFTKVRVVESGCWEWQGHIAENGYGGFWDGEKRTTAHRWIYNAIVGPLKPWPKWLIHHTCENTKCVNPQHLEQITHSRHGLIGDSPPAINARKTHCKRGHELSGKNLRTRPSKGRECWTCHRRLKRERRSSV